MNRKRCCNLLIRVLIISIFVAQLGYAQPLDPAKELTQYNLDHWEGDKLPSSIIQMMQASDGYLWMTTLNGLVRFDGLKFTVFDKYNTTSLETNGFKSIYEDRYKHFWVGSIGAGLYLKQYNSFRKFTIPFGTSSNNIERIFLDSKDNLWLCTLKGLILYKDSVFSLITPKGYSEKSDITMYDIDEDNQGNLWIASAQGIFKYADGELKKHTWEGDPLKGEVATLRVSRNQNIWIGTYGSGVFIVNNNVVKRVPELALLARPTVIIEDDNQNIWIGSEYGVARYSENGVSHLLAGKGLTHNHIAAICEDHEGSVWLGTYYGGLNRLRDGTFTNYTTLNGLPHNTIHAIYQTPDSTIWVGTESDVGYYKQRVFNILSQQFPELERVRVRDVFMDSFQNLWIASYDGLYRLTEQILTKFSTENGLSSNQTRVVFEDKDKNLWVGTRNGLNLFKNGQWKTFSSEQGLQNSFIMSIIQLHDGKLMVGTTGGVYFLDGNTFKPLITDLGEVTNTIFRMHQDNEDYLWIGTNSGLLCIKDGKCHAFISDHKLLSGNVYQILEDGIGTMWITTEVGIVRVAKKNLIQKMVLASTTLNLKLFDKSSGLRTNEITPTSKAMISLDGKIWFPTLGGVAVINPSNIIINKTPPPMVIDKVIVAGVEVNPNVPINIAPNSRNIEIHYTGLSFMVPKKVQFQYMLSGFDETWIDAGDRRVAYFSLLPPGDYTFKIKASNNDSVWNTDENALQIHVERAFWQTPIFYIAAVIFVILFLFGLADYRTRRIKRLNRFLDDKITERTTEVIQQKEEIEAQRDYIESKNKELEKARNVIVDQYEKLQEVNENLEQKVEKRTNELQKANSDLIHANEELDHFVYKSSHDIKGPLARLQGLCNLALMEAPNSVSKEYLILLQRESELANRVIQKLSHAHEVKNLKVEATSVNLLRLINHIIQKLLISHPESSKVDFKLNIDSLLELKSDRQLMKEVFYNLIENAIIFRSLKDSLIEIDATIQKEKLIVQIKDNGIGIDPKVKDDIFKMFVKGSERSQGLGLGLYIVKRALEPIMATIELKKSNLGRTEFEIVLPVTLL